MIRQMYRDIYLPFICYASRTSFYSQVSSCECMVQCKFMALRGNQARELRQNRDYPNLTPVKDPE
jgi:hypothetical protein